MREAPGADAGERAEGPARRGALLVVGDVVTDVVARHRGPLASGTDTAAVIRTLPGGAGANVACWAAHWGCADVRLLGRVGADGVAWHERELIGCGVRPRLVVDPEASTGTVICLVDTGSAAERTFLTDSGASLRLGPGDWSDSLLDGVGRLHLSGYLLFSASGRALVRTAVTSARARGVPVSLDPASAGFLPELGADRFLALVRGVDVLLPSRDEACLLTGLPDGADAAAALSRHVPLVVAKQGADGALVARDGAVTGRVPAVAATPRDTTGAGDAFTGAFLAALLAGAGPGVAAAEGCRAGARAVERVGGRPSAAADAEVPAADLSTPTGGSGATTARPRPGDRTAPVTGPAAGAGRPAPRTDPRPAG
ncbi:carbohydrate kinase family protein [Streptomyces sp. NPDC017936]|uniref:carbohydrate kinase family protein n=1 Tax=Streptomyces sp. NPDC017936 TaxID=3365016 RepID=UPI0037920D5D